MERDHLRMRAHDGIPRAGVGEWSADDEIRRRSSANGELTPEYSVRWPANGAPTTVYSGRWPASGELTTEDGARRPVHGALVGSVRISVCEAVDRHVGPVNGAEDELEAAGGSYDSSPGLSASISARSLGRAAARLLRRNISRPRNATRREPSGPSTRSFQASSHVTPLIALMT